MPLVTFPKPLDYKDKGMQLYGHVCNNPNRPIAASQVTEVKSEVYLFTEQRPVPSNQSKINGLNR